MREAKNRVPGNLRPRRCNKVFNEGFLFARNSFEDGQFESEWISTRRVATALTQGSRKVQKSTHCVSGEFCFNANFGHLKQKI